MNIKGLVGLRGEGWPKRGGGLGDRKIVTLRGNIISGFEIF